MNDDMLPLWAGALMLVILLVIIGFWANSADSACKQRYGQDAELHSNRAFNECLMPDGTIKGLD